MQLTQLPMMGPANNFMAQVNSGALRSPYYQSQNERPGAGFNLRLGERANHALSTGSSYSDSGHYIGMGAGCLAGGGVTVITSAVSAGATALLTGTACTAGAETGSDIGEVAGGILGIVVGFIDY